MTENERTFWDDLDDVAREIARKINDLLHPEKKRELARVPVPVYGKKPPPAEESYRNTR